MRSDQGRLSGRIGTALFIAWRNLTRERRRWLLSASALAVAATMVLFLEGISRWLTVSSTAYLDHSGAQIVVSEKGIEDLLFAQSAFPPEALTAVRAIAGVRSVDEIVGVNGIVAAGRAHLPAYLVGFRVGGGGGPWQMVSGSARPAGAEVVVDRGFASIAGIRVGDSVGLFGHRLRVVGISSGTNAAGDFFLFTPLDFAQWREQPQSATHSCTSTPTRPPRALRLTSTGSPVWKPCRWRPLPATTPPPSSRALASPCRFWLSWH